MAVLVSCNPCLLCGVYNSTVSLKLLYKSAFCVITFRFFNAETEGYLAARANITGSVLESACSETANGGSLNTVLFNVNFPWRLITNSDYIEELKLEGDPEKLQIPTSIWLNPTVDPNYQSLDPYLHTDWCRSELPFIHNLDLKGTLLSK